MKINKVNRVEVIDESGRAYVKYLDKDQELTYTLQDGGKTLKMFISNTGQKDT